MCIVKSAWLLWMAISVFHIVTDIFETFILWESCSCQCNRTGYKMASFHSIWVSFELTLGWIFSWDLATLLNDILFPVCICACCWALCVTFSHDFMFLWLQSDLSHDIFGLCDWLKNRPEMTIH